MSPLLLDPARCARAGILAIALACLSPLPAAAIVGGAEDAARSSVMVLSSRGGTCTGIVIAPDVILTAAHCLSGATEHRVHFRGADGAPVLLEPKNVVLHPGFSPAAERTRKASIDLALIRLGEDLPARFEPATLSIRRPAKASDVAASGYGLAREADGRSGGSYRSVRLGVVEPHGPGRILIWAAPPHGQAGACHGDSGGPLSVDGAVVASITWAKGHGQQACGSLTQGTLLAPQRSWIDTTLSRWGRSTSWR